MSLLFLRRYQTDISNGIIPDVEDTNTDLHNSYKSELTKVLKLSTNYPVILMYGF